MQGGYSAALEWTEETIRSGGELLLHSYHTYHTRGRTVDSNMMPISYLETDMVETLLPPSIFPRDIHAPELQTRGYRKEKKDVGWISRTNNDK